jgi:hypothetical protein
MRKRKPEMNLMTKRMMNPRLKMKKKKTNNLA